MKFKYLPDLDIIQWEIIRNLNSFGTKRFSEIKPDDIENDLFNYHLKFLVTKGLVVKSIEGYELSKEGKKLVHSVDSQGLVYDQFKYSVILYVLRFKDGELEILSHRNNRHPFINDVSTIAGKIRKGELVEDAANRKLFEEARLNGNFSLIGVLRKIRREKESRKVLEDTIYNVCLCNNPEGDLVEKNDFGENKWVKFFEYKKLVQKNVDFGEYDIKVIDLVESRKDNMFYFQQDMVVESY